MTTVDETDTGKTVVTSKGERVGVVESVHDDHVHVDTDAGLADEVKSALGWGGREADDATVETGDVDTVGPHKIRLGSGR